MTDMAQVDRLVAAMTAAMWSEQPGLTAEVVLNTLSKFSALVVVELALPGHVEKVHANLQRITGEWIMHVRPVAGSA